MKTWRWLRAQDSVLLVITALEGWILRVPIILILTGRSQSTKVMWVAMLLSNLLKMEYCVEMFKKCTTYFSVFTGLSVIWILLAESSSTIWFLLNTSGCLCSTIHSGLHNLFSLPYSTYPASCPLLGGHTGFGDICPVGYHCPEGSVVPQGCPAGSYQDELGQDYCKACPAGECRF